MNPSISDFYGTIHRSLHSNNYRVRCLSISELRDTDEIEREMIKNSLIVLFFRGFRIKNPIDAKRFLQYLNAFIRKYEYSILNLGKFDYFLLLPKEFEITDNSL
ncbi:MAG: hypothetical protein ACTSW1_10405 [Candidatus Hodarchaeales archaeon]